jgi:hypothetical protein
MRARFGLTRECLGESSHTCSSALLGVQITISPSGSLLTCFLTCTARRPGATPADAVGSSAHVWLSHSTHLEAGDSPRRILPGR